MNTFVTVVYWYFLLLIVLRVIILCACEYPRTQEISVGSDVVSLLILIAFTVWSGLLAFGVIQ